MATRGIITPDLIAGKANDLRMDPTVISMIESLITQKVEDKLKEADIDEQVKEEEPLDFGGIVSNDDKPIDVEDLDIKIDFSD